MIRGLDYSYWGQIKDPSVVFTQKEDVDIAIPRGFDGYRDDTRFVENRKILVNAKNSKGSVLWTSYMFAGYSGNVGSYSWSAARGDAQAANFWALISSGGVEFQLPAAIDSERIRFQDNNKVFQVVPLPNVYSYCDNILLPAIDYLSSAQNRRPLFYSNPDIILNYLAPALQVPKYAPILECPLWLAGYADQAIPPYWDRVSQYWKQWLIWQFKGDVKDWPGITDVDLNKCQGTRAQWKAWSKDPSAPLPSETAPDPVPTPCPVGQHLDPVTGNCVPDVPPDPGPTPGQFDRLYSAIQGVQTELDAVKAKLDKHFT